MPLLTSVSCAYCSCDFTSGRGRLRKWCSESCRLKAYRQQDRRGACVDCAGPSWGKRCRHCDAATRVNGRPSQEKQLCHCGNLRSPKAKQCMACWHEQIQRPGGRRKRVWVPYLSETSTSTSRWRRLRAQVIAEEPNCRIGITAVCTGVSDTADHIVPRSLRPDLMFERSNLRGACHACNSSLGNGGIARSRLKITPACLAIEGLGQAKCAVCSAPFQRRFAAHKYCGAHCRAKSKCPGSVVVAAQCKICDVAFDSLRGMRYCSDECRAEANARQIRDRYRKRQGLPVDPARPTKSFGRRRPWRDGGQHPKTPASVAG